VLNYTIEAEMERQLTVVKSRSNNLGEQIRLRFSGELGYEVIKSAAAMHSAIEKFQSDSVRVVRAEAEQGRVTVTRKTILEALQVLEGSPQSQTLDHALRRNLVVGTLVRPAKGVYALPPVEASKSQTVE
jgi:hypothetical protein